MRSIVSLLMVMAILASFASVASADVNVATGITIPVISSKQTVVHAVSQVQFEMDYLGVNRAWTWSQKMNEFPKNLPTGLGSIIRVYPNVVTDNNGIKGVYVSFAELYKEITLPCKYLLECKQDDLGRWYVDVPIDKFAGAQCMRIYALIDDAKRNQTDVLFVFHFVDYSQAIQLVGTFEYTTAPWYGDIPKDPVVVAETMRDAAVGGYGLVYDQIAKRKAERAEAIRKNNEASEEKPATGSLDLVVNINGLSQFKNVRIEFAQNGNLIKTHNPNGQSSIIVPLSVGDYQIRVVVDGGRGDWYPISVCAGMKPVNINLHKEVN